MMKMIWPQWLQRYWKTLLVLVVCGSLAAHLLRQSVTVDHARVTRGDYREVIEEDGKTRAKDTFLISAPVDGTLSRITLKPGDAVKKHQVVAQVSPSASALLTTRAERVLHAQVGRAQANLAEAKIMVERAKVAFQTAQSEYQRKVKLSTQGFVSETELEQQKLQVELRKKEFEAAQFTVRSASHEVTRVEAELENIKQDSNGDGAVHLSVHSPIDGQVIQVLRESFGSINRGTTIMEVADLHHLEVVVELLSQEAVKIPPDAKATIRRWGGEQDLQGRVRLIEPGGFTKLSALGVEEQRVNVVIELTSEYDYWKNLGVGYRVDTVIEVAEMKNQVLVPTSALFRDGKQWAVFHIVNGKANKQVVEITRYNSDVAVLRRGLNVDDQVVIYPSDNLRDGDRVKTRE